MDKKAEVEAERKHGMHGDVQYIRLRALLKATSYCSILLPLLKFFHLVLSICCFSRSFQISILWACPSAQTDRLT